MVTLTVNLTIQPKIPISPDTHLRPDWEEYVAWSQVIRERRETSAHSPTYLTLVSLRRPPVRLIYPWLAIKKNYPKVEKIKKSLFVKRRHEFLNVLLKIYTSVMSQVLRRLAVSRAVFFSIGRVWRWPGRNSKTRVVEAVNLELVRCLVSEDSSWGENFNAKVRVAKREGKLICRSRFETETLDSPWSCN